MNVKRMEKVTNGWIAYDDFGIPVAVATSEEQLADILDINISPVPAYTSNSVYLTMNPEFNFNHFWQDVKARRKIEAIKAFRKAFVSNDHGTVSVGLREAKDFVESIFDNIGNRY